MSDLRDADLISAAREHDGEAFAELYRRHRDAARAAAASLRVPYGDREDIVAEAFANVLAVLHAGRGPTAAFRPYLITVVRNVVFSWWRRGRRSELREQLYSTDVLVTQTSERLPLDDLVSDAFDTLPTRWRDVLRALDIEQRRPADVAAEIGLSANALAALTMRARRGLRAAYLHQYRRDSELTLPATAGRSTPPPNPTPARVNSHPPRSTALLPRALQRPGPLSPVAA